MTVRTGMARLSTWKRAGVPSLLFLLSILACREGEMPSTESIALKSATERSETLVPLRDKRVCVGHQSVGGEIIDGVKMLAAEGGLDLKVVRSREPASIEGPAILEHAIGENGDPASKNREFAAIMRGG